ncbi:MAG: hypothetical protein WC626_10695 [Methanoregula sp.]
MRSLASTIIVGAILSLIAAGMCARGGEKYVYEIHGPNGAELKEESGIQEIPGDKSKMNKERIYGR